MFPYVALDNLIWNLFVRNVNMVTGDRNIHTLENLNQIQFYVIWLL